MKKLLLFLVFVFITGIYSFGQLSGPKYIPGDYATITAAIAALNPVGVGGGGVTFEVAAGYTETIAATLSITATGTLANPIVFRKDPATTGANPKITAYMGTATPGSAIQDGIWRLVGSDYVTIDGIDLYDPNSTNPATMEYGFGFFKASVTDGCQYNTIQNCTVTLSRANFAAGTSPAVDGSRCINIMNCLAATQTTVATPTSAAGTNSYNKIYGNTLQQCNYGIALIGYAAASPFTLADQGNDIGGSSSATGNTIINWGGGTGSAVPTAGIRTLAQYGLNVSYNSVNNNNGSGVNGTVAIRGIYLNTATSASSDINHNAITVKSGGTTTTVYAIDIQAGSTAASNTINVNYNTIQNCEWTTITTGSFYGINVTCSATNVNINNNTINGMTGGPTGTTNNIYGINHTTGATNLIANYNQISNISGYYTTGGNMYGIYASAGTNRSVNNNTINDFTINGSTSGGTMYGIYYGTTSGTNQTANDNLIFNFSLNGPSGIGGYIYGIRSYTATVVHNNNFIHDLVINKTTGTSGVYGIYNAGSPTNENYNTNFIYNLSHSGAGSVAGIYLNTTTGTRTVSGNTINSLSNNGSSLYGMYQASSSPNIFKNKIYDLINNGSTGLAYGLYMSSGTVANINNNYIGNIYAPNSSPATASYLAVAGLYIGGGTTMNVYYNTINLDASSGGSNFTASAVYASTTPAVTLLNNILNNTSTPAGSGFAVAYQRSGTTLTSYGAASNNNFFFTGSPDGQHLIFYDGTNAMQDMPAYQALAGLAPRDNVSISDPAGAPFVSLSGADPTFLHIDETISTGIESGGAAITGYDNDYDGDIRFGNTGYSGGGTAPDIGADEFEGIPSYTCGTPNPGNTVSSANAICLGQSVILSLENTTTGTGVIYDWYKSTDGVNYFMIPGAHSPGYTVTPDAETYYYCNVTCQNGPESTPSNPVLITFSSNITGTTPASRCGAGTVDLEATASAGTITWYGAQTGGTALGTGSPWTTPIISSTTTYWVSAQGSGPANGVLGTSTTNQNSTTSWPAPYGNYDENGKHHLLILGSELSAAGLVAGNLNSLTFDVASVGTSGIHNAFTIRIANTALTALTTTMETTGFITVFGPVDYQPVTGANTHLFTTSFPWDGTSNIIIEVCFTNDDGIGGTHYTNNAIMNRTTTSYNSVAYKVADNTAQCPLSTGATVSNVRPNMVINGTGTCSSPRTEVTATMGSADPLTITGDQLVCNDAVAMLTVTSNLPDYDFYAWSPETDLFTDALCTTPYTGTSETTVYFKTATAGSYPIICTSSNSVSQCANIATSIVTILPASPAVTANPGSLCLSGTSVLTTNPSSGYGTATLQWQNSPDNSTFTDIPGANSINYTTPTITSTTYYKLQVKIGANVCTESNSDTVVVNNPQILTTTPGGRCGTGTVELRATGTSTLNWYTGPSGGAIIGTGSPFTTPSISANTTYYVAAEASPSATVTLGTATTTTNGSGMTPYNSNWEGSREQYLVKASELQALGFPAGNIQKLAFNVTALGAGTVAQSGFTIKIAHTANTTIGPGYGTPAGSFTTVYGPLSQPLPTVGWYTYTFTSAFNWDGVSNILIDICHDNDINGSCSSCYSSNSTVEYTATSYSSCFGSYADNIQSCGVTATSTISTYTDRPNMKFTVEGCGSARTAVLATVTAPTNVIVTSNPGTICEGQSSFIEATSTNPNYLYVWSPGSLSGPSHTVIPAATTNYSVTATDPASGCVAIGSTTVTVNPKPSSVTASASASPVCEGVPVNLTSSASSNVTATTTFISPTGNGGFESGPAFSDNGWTVVNDAVNYWIISNMAPAYGGTQGAHISLNGTAYDYNSAESGVKRTSHFYRDVVIPAGSSNINLSFYWKGNGESGWDRLLVYTAPTSVTPVAGTPASNSTTLTGAALIFAQSTFPQSDYIQTNITLPNSLAGTTVRLIFTWQNDDSGGTPPPAAIDNISLTSSATENCTYSWASNPVGFTSSDQNPMGVVVNTTTEYIVTAQNSHGCTSTASTTVTATAGGVTINAQPSPESKCAGQNATFTVDASGPALTYHWRKGGMNIDESLNPSAITSILTLPTVSALDADDYDVVITPGCGTPQTSDVVALTVKPVPTATASSNSPVCENGSLEFTGATDIGTIFSWAGPDGFASSGSNPSINPVTLAATGTYSYTATLDGCTSLPSDISVTVNTTPSAVTITPSSATICPGSIQQLTASGGIVTANVIAGSGAIALPIPDNDANGASNTIAISTIPAGSIIDSVIITVNITHTWDSDVQLNLEAPNGQIINLVAGQGSSGDNFTNTRISSDYNMAPFSSGTAPFTGTFSALRRNSGLIATLAVTTTTFTDLFTIPDGNWIIRTYDGASGDIGTLDNWSIHIYYKATSVSWLPVDDLYNDALATDPYLGGSAITVYAKPTINRTYTATATIGSCSSAGSSVLTTSSIVTWTGIQSTAWNVAGNWCGNVPVSTTDILIPNAANLPEIGETAGIVNFDASCRNVTINPGAHIVIHPNSSLTVSGDLVLNQDDGIVVKSNVNGTGTLITQAGVSGSGSAQVQRHVTPGRWFFISSPVVSQVSALFMGAWLKDYNEPTNLWNYPNISTTQPLLIGKGFAVWDTTTGGRTFMFNGLPNTGNITPNPAISYSGASNGYNLIGNPYPSAIDWDHPSWTKTNVDATIYAWNNSGNYINWNGTIGDITDGIIPADQAFFIHTNGASPAIMIPNASRCLSTHAFYKSLPADLLVLNAVGNGYSDKTFINFNAGATNNFDTQFDGYKLWGIAEAPQLYSYDANVKYSINVLPTLLPPLTVPLGFIAGVNGNYSITASEINTFDQNILITLEDLKTSQVTDLRQNAVYNFSATNTDDPNRFLVHFGRSTTGIDNSENNNMNIYSYAGNIYINSNGSEGTVYIYDMLGRQIASERLKPATINKLTVTTTGYYLVKVVTGKDVSLKKVFCIL